MSSVMVLKRHVGSLYIVYYDIIRKALPDFGSIWGTLTLFSAQRKNTTAQKWTISQTGRLILWNAIELGYRFMTVSARNILAKGILHLFKEME